jgi:hypothetical protein
VILGAPGKREKAAQNRWQNGARERLEKDDFAHHFALDDFAVRMEISFLLCYNIL